MASANGSSQNAGNGTNRRQHTIRIPIPRNLGPDQRFSISLNMPGQMVQGQRGAQQVPIRVINVGVAPPQQGQGANPILQQLQQQQRERMEREEHQREQLREKQKELKEREERAKREDRTRKDKLRSKLGFKQSPQVKFDDKECTAELSWEKKEVEVLDSSAEVKYSVLTSYDEKLDTKEIYNGTENCYTVPSEVLTLGHTHHFTVSSSVGDITGEPSPRCSLNVPALPPSKPLPPKISSRNKNTLTLRWNAPQDNGAPIILYELEWDQCKDEWEKLVSDKAKQYKFTRKLSPASFAQFRVRAANSIGMSPYSDPLEFSSGASAPSVPQPPSLAEAGIKHIALEWTPPESNGADITSYTLEMEDPESGYGYRPVYQGENASFTCSNLQRVTGYNFRLIATNIKGSSPTSPSVTHHTLPNLPGPPAPPFLKDRPTPTALSITWKEPPDNGGAEIQTYMLQLSEGSVSDSGTELGDVYMGPGKNYVAEGLQPGKKYQSRVCAISVAGQGEWSSHTVFSTPAVCPSPPLYLCVVGNPTQTSVTIQWGYPLSDGGSPVTSYNVEMKSSSSLGWNMVATVADPRNFEDSPSHSSSTPSLVHTITQLMPGEHYEFRVTCHNAMGVSTPSVECSGVTAPGQPNCPDGVGVSDISATSVQVNWKIPQTHGCPVESYELQCFAERQSDQVLSSTSITNQSSLRNLTPATWYQARVKALSSAGASDWSLPVMFTTSSSTPSPPSHINLISRTPYSLLIAWNVPRANGSAICAYHIEVGTDSGLVPSHVIKVGATETQHTIPDLKPSTMYRYRVQAENDVGKGLFGSYGSGSTLPPPPSPPHLTLSSCSAHILKVSWGKKPNRNITYILHMASQGNQFHEVYRGSAVTHRIVRLQPDSEYTLKIAAISESGQGEWSDRVTFLTTPIPPTAPVGIEFTQVSNSVLQLDWQAGEFPHPLIYEAQYRVANVNQDYQQCYKGPKCSSQITLTSQPANSGSTVVYEAHVRSCAMCTVNGREEQLWSSYSSPALCRWEKEIVKKEPTEEAEKVMKSKDEGKSWISGWTVGVLLFTVVTLFAIVVALILGQVAI